MKRPSAYLLISLLACALVGSWTGQPAAQDSAPKVYLAPGSEAQLFGPN